MTTERNKEIKQVMHWIMTFDLDAIADYLGVPPPQLHKKTIFSIKSMYVQALQLALWRKKKEEEMEKLKYVENDEDGSPPAP